MRGWGRIGRFWKREDGGVTVEAVLWLPFFFALLILITDASLMFYGKAQAYRVLEAGNRARATGRIDTAAATATWIENAYDAISPNADATSYEDGGIITTEMTVPASDLMLFGSLTAFGSITMNLRAQQFLEEI